MRNKKKIQNCILIMLLLSLGNIGYCQTQTFIGNDFRHQRIKNSIITSNGQLILVGQEADNSIVDSNSDAVIYSTNKTGETVNWDIRIGNGNSANDVYTSVIEVDSGDIIAVGYAGAISNTQKARGLVTRLDATGQIKWSQEYFKDTSGVGEIIRGIAYDSVQNRIYICGTVNAAAGVAESFVACLNPANGNLIWDNEYDMTIAGVEQTAGNSDDFATIQYCNNRLYVMGILEYSGSNYSDLTYLVLNDANGVVVNSATYDINFINRRGVLMESSNPSKLIVRNTGNGIRFLLAGTASHTFDVVSGFNHFVMGGSIDSAGNLSIENINSYQNNNNTAIVHDNNIAILPTDSNLINFILSQGPSPEFAGQPGSLTQAIPLESTITSITNFTQQDWSIQFANEGLQEINSLNQNGNDLLLVGCSFLGNLQTTLDGYVINIPNGLDTVLVMPRNPCPIIADTILIDTVNRPLIVMVASHRLLNLQQQGSVSDIPNVKVRNACARPCIDSFTTVIDYTNNRITRNTIFNGKFYVESGVKIQVPTGISLDITNVDMVFGECAGIEVEGILRANNSVFRPCEIDRTWSGIAFSNSDTNIIAECTFKNALTALEFINSSARINNNYFQDCKYGIHTLESIFNNPITGNNFVYDNEYSSIIEPNSDSCAAPDGQFGIISEFSNFTADISKNIFTNSTSMDDPGVDFVAIHAYQSGLERVSLNRISNFPRAINYTECYEGFLEIINNEIEDISSRNYYLSQIHLINCGANTSIRSNKLNCSPGIALSNLHHGIELISSSNVEVKDNNVFGFNAGIALQETHQSQIVNNTIFDPTVAGFYILNSSDNDIRCNEIDMNHKGVGMQFENSSNIKIYTNCVSNSDYAVYFGNALNPTGNQLESSIDFYNNFLYNYAITGVHNEELQNLFIGNSISDRAGQNTFWSNKGSGSVFDVYTSTSLSPIATFVYNNYYDIATFNGSHTQMYNVKDHYSTASCGHQIVDRDNNSSYNRAYDCDNIRSGDDGEEKTASQVAEHITESTDPVGMTIAFFSAYNNSNTLYKSEEIYQELIGSQKLEDNDKNWITFYKNYLAKDNTSAGQALNNILPNTEADILLKEYYFFCLKYVGKSVRGISDPALAKFLSSNSEVNKYTNLVAPILTMNGIPVNYYITPIPESKRPAAGAIMQQFYDEEFSIYPNPSTGIIKMKIVNSQSEELIVKVFSIEGKLVESYDLTLLAGIASIDLSKLSKGTYLINLTNNQFSKTQKIILE